MMPSYRLARWTLPLLLVLSVTAGAAEWKAGAAKVNITPPQLMWMSGYAARTHPAEGKLDDLWAEALVLDDSAGHQAVLVTLDLCGIDRVFSLDVRGAIAERHPQAKDRVMLCVSHTHSGPVVEGNLSTMYFLDAAQQKLVADYTKALKANIQAAVEEAYGHLQPCTLAWGLGQSNFAVNRRNNPENEAEQRRADGTLRGPSDHDVPVLAVRSAKNELLAIVFGYACHATTLDGYQWSGDYPSYARLELEKSHPGAIALFWQGCGGDQNPLPRRAVPLAIKYGQQLATAVDKVLADRLEPISPSIRSNYAEIDLTFAHIPDRAELEATAKSDNKYEASRAKHLLTQLDVGKPLAPTYPYPVATWVLGDKLRWAFLGGEVVVDYSLRLKQELPGLWVTGYSTDVMAYIPSRRVLAEGGYEGGGAMVYYGQPSPWTPEIEEKIVAEVHRQLK